MKVFNNVSSGVKPFFTNDGNEIKITFNNRDYIPVIYSIGEPKDLYLDLTVNVNTGDIVMLYIKLSGKHLAQIKINNTVMDVSDFSDMTADFLLGIQSLPGVFKLSTDTINFNF